MSRMRLRSTVAAIVAENIARESALMTDESRIYGDVKEHSRARDREAHRWRIRRAASVHTNTVEGYFSIFKRGMGGIYQHCDEKHLHRYLAEFDFRYNTRVALGINDSGRADRISPVSSASASPIKRLVQGEPPYGVKPPSKDRRPKANREKGGKTK